MKGISNIISAVLLLAISISIVSIYSSWAPELSENATQSAVNQANQDIKCDNAALSIKDPVYDSSVDETLFELVNSGNIRFTGNITVAAIESTVLNKTTVEGLDVGQSISRRIPSSQKPDMIVISSSECPSLSVRRTQISDG